MDMAISHIDMGYLVTLPLVRGLARSSTARNVAWRRARWRGATGASCWCARTCPATKAGAYTRPLSAQHKRFLWDKGCIEELFRGCFAGVWEVSGGVGGCKGCILCQTRLRLSWKVDECKPLYVGAGPGWGGQCRLTASEPELKPRLVSE